MRSSALILALLLLLPATAALAKDAEPVNKTCPVMVGEEVDPDLHVDYQGKRVWFCCESCVEDFQEDPEAYLANLPQFSGDEKAAAAAAAAAAGDAEDDDGSADEEENGGAGAAAAGAAAPAPADDGDEAAGEDGDESEEHEVAPESRGETEEHPLGVLHPMFVHFPIALAMAALIAALLGLVIRTRFLRDARTWCVVLAALFAIPTFLLGEEAEEARGRMTESLHERIEVHQDWGTIALWVLIGVAVLEIVHRLAPNAKWLKWVSLLAVVGAAVVVGITGWRGAEVTHGAGHLEPVLRLIGLK